MQNIKQSLSKKEKILSILVIAFTMLLFIPSFSFAEGPFDMVANALSSVYDELRIISTGVAIVAAVIALLMRMFSRNPQAKAQSTSWLIGIVVAWVAIQTLGITLDWLKTLFPDTPATMGAVINTFSSVV